MPVLMLQDPQQLHTVEALREALTRANEALAAMSQELEVTHGAVARSLDTLCHMVVFRMHGDTDAILATLDELITQTRAEATHTGPTH